MTEKDRISNFTEKYYKLLNSKKEELNLTDTEIKNSLQFVDFDNGILDYQLEQSFLAKIGEIVKIEINRL